jgi:hypothetical protein
MSSVPFSASEIQQPASPLDQYGKTIQLASMLQEQKLRQQQLQTAQQLAPSQVQQAQASAGSAQIDYEMKKLMYGVMSDPTIGAEVAKELDGGASADQGAQPTKSQASEEVPANSTGTTGTPSFVPAASGSEDEGAAPAAPTSSGAPRPFDPATYADALTRVYIRHGMNPLQASQMVQPLYEQAKTRQALTAGDQDIYIKTHGKVTDRLQPIVDLNDQIKTESESENPDQQKIQLMQKQQQDLLKNFEGDLAENPQGYPGLSQNEWKTLNQLPKIDPQHIGLIVNQLGLDKDMATRQKAAADTQVAQIDAFKKAHDIPTDADFKPENVSQIVSENIPNHMPGETAVDPVLDHFQKQAIATFGQTLRSSSSVEAAQKALDPIKESANRYMVGPSEEKDKMAAAYQQNTLLAQPLANTGQFREQIKIGNNIYDVTDTGRTLKTLGQLGPYVDTIQARDGSVPIDEKSAASLRSLSADSQELSTQVAALKKFTATSAGSRLLNAPLNKIRQMFETDPDLAAARGIFALDSMKASKDLLSSGGQGGMRGASPELAKVGSQLWPNAATDTLGSYLKKAENLQSQFEQVGDATVGHPMSQLNIQPKTPTSTQIQLNF